MNPACSAALLTLPMIRAESMLLECSLFSFKTYCGFTFPFKLHSSHLLFYETVHCCTLTFFF